MACPLHISCGLWPFPQDKPVSNQDFRPTLCYLKFAPAWLLHTSNPCLIYPPGDQYAIAFAGPRAARPGERQAPPRPPGRSAGGAAAFWGRGLWPRPLRLSKKWLAPLFRGFHSSLAPTARPGSYAGKPLLRKAFCGFAVHAAKSDESLKGLRSSIRQRFLDKLGAGAKGPGPRTCPLPGSPGSGRVGVAHPPPPPPPPGFPPTPKRQRKARPHALRGLALDR